MGETDTIRESGGGHDTGRRTVRGTVLRMLRKICTTGKVRNVQDRKENDSTMQDFGNESAWGVRLVKILALRGPRLGRIKIDRGGQGGEGSREQGGANGMSPIFIASSHPVRYSTWYCSTVF
jgi:hypothetical protein